MAKMVKANLTGSFGYRLPSGERKYYGPGEGIEIPKGLAITLGVPWQELGEQVEPEQIKEMIEAPLPDSFPGKKWLVVAGYGTYESLSGLTFDDLVALKGIGNATAEAILFNLPKEGMAIGEERTDAVAPGNELVED